MAMLEVLATYTGGVFKAPWGKICIKPAESQVEFISCANLPDGAKKQANFRRHFA